MWLQERCRPKLQNTGQDWPMLLISQAHVFVKSVRQINMYLCRMLSPPLCQFLRGTVDRDCLSPATFTSLPLQANQWGWGNPGKSRKSHLDHQMTTGSPFAKRPGGWGINLSHLGPPCVMETLGRQRRFGSWAGGSPYHGQTPESPTIRSLFFAFVPSQSSTALSYC